MEFKDSFYKTVIKSLDDNAVIMQVKEDGTYYPIWCSEEFTDMMEGTAEDFIRLENGGTMNTIHPDDRKEVAYLFRHHVTRDNTNSLTFRKLTVQNHWIWVNVHYAFVKENDIQYAYCTYVNITEIKLREQLAEEAKRERAAIRVLHDMMKSGPWYMEFDENGNMISVTWTNTFRKMLGYQNTEDFPDKLESWSDLLHADDKERVLKEYFDTIHDYTGQKTYDVEYRMITKNHEWRWYHAFGQLSRRPDGSPITYVGMFIDITEQKKLQQQLAEREQEQVLYNNMLAQFNAIADESLTIVHANMSTDVIEEVRGSDLYPTDTAGNSLTSYVESRLNSFLVEGDREKYIKLIEKDTLLGRTANGQEPATMIAFCKRASGHPCFVKFSATASRNPLTGDIDSFGIESEYNSEMVSEVLNEKILAQQYDMVTYIVNGFYGVTIGDAANIEKGSIFPKERNGVYMDYVRDQVMPVVVGTKEEKQQLLHTLSMDTIEEQLTKREPYIVDVTCEIQKEIFNKRFYFFTVDRERHIYILLKSDMTNILREQQERNTILASALHEAEQANVAKTAFLSSMSHEIRTPMNAIIGLNSIALNNPALPEATRDYLEKIDASAKHLLGLINDILDMSRIESGRMILKNEEFSFSNMLDQINTMIHSQCQDKGLEYDCKLLSRVDDYYIGDDMKLKQIIINILGNAVKFTPAPGTVTLTVEQTGRFEDHSTLRFVMKDTGIGMDADYLPRIFEPFSQEYEGRTTKYGSTGLGMAITKNIVEMMNGTISVESEKGVGSEFTVTITLKNSSRTGSYVEDVNIQEIHTLIIDDDPVACEHAKLVLEEIGIYADTCLNGIEALKMIEVRHARLEPYQLILVDLRMPEQDGIEVTREIRKLYNGESTIIILTAYNWDDVLEEALHAGVDSFMSKPLFASNVIDEFKRILTRKNMEQEHQEHHADLTGRHILLAEDVMINAEIMITLLEIKDMKIDHAENGQIAVDTFAASAPNYYDAIFMDVRMPVMDGLAAASAIRALDRPDAKTVPIIAMTANAFDEDVQNSLQAGMNAHLSKPVDPDQVYATLERLIPN